MRNPISRQRFEAESAMQTALQELISAELKTAHDFPHAIVISGGRTPVPVYNAIAEAPFRPDGFAHVMFSDDRHVPLDDPASNFGNARPMLEALGLSDGRTLRIDPGLDLDACASDYENRVRGFFARGGILTLALLGLGSDGHTCSLFSDKNLAASAGRYAIPVMKPESPDRVSLTPEVLSRAERVIFVVSGEEKNAVVEELLRAPQDLVAGRAVARCESVSLWQA